MEREKEIINKIREKSEQLEIPAGLDPEWMQETLKEHERKQYFRKGRLYPAHSRAYPQYARSGPFVSKGHSETGPSPEDREI